MKSYLNLVSFTIIGFYIGFLIFGKVKGVNISFKEALTGISPEYGILNKTADDLLTTARLKMLATAFVGFFVGVILLVIGKITEKRQASQME
ncbi:MAG TPA: hypothetical protein DCQ31_01250 [Bacteroidales bacterium]|nr:hypothetical protein [Bacteroidales bacterium]